jgi:hypothetical protein
MHPILMYERITWKNSVHEGGAGRQCFSLVQQESFSGFYYMQHDLQYNLGTMQINVMGKILCHTNEAKVWHYINEIQA